MKEVAEHLGLSRTTVSLVLQGRGDEYRISRETQQMVLDYVKRPPISPTILQRRLIVVEAILSERFSPMFSNPL